MVFDKKTGIRKMNWGVKNRKGPSDKSLIYSIENSKIVFKNEDELLVNNKPYNELYNHLNQIIENQKFLSVDFDKSKEVKKLLRAEIIKNQKINIGETELISKNIESYLKILLKLQAGRI